MNLEELQAIDVAVASVRDRLQPEDRFDLRQELAIKLLAYKPSGELRAWLTTCARNWVFNFLRDQAAYYRILEEYRAGGAVPGCRRGDLWHPTWYAPHPDATEDAPFQCKGARMMACKPSKK